MLNAVRSVLADVSSVSPSSEERAFRLREKRILRNVTYSILSCGGVCSALIEVLLLFTEGHQLHHPPLPPIFFFVFLSTLAS